MKVFFFVVLSVAGLLLLLSCHRNSEDTQTITIGMDQDHNLKTYCEGSGWSGMSVSKSSFTDFDKTIKYAFLANEGAYALMSTQHYSIWISGTVKPLSNLWDYYSWNLQVSSKMPFRLVFSGFENTNGFKTNEDGMVFDCLAGKTNLVLTNQLILVYDRETNSWDE